MTVRVGLGTLVLMTFPLAAAAQAAEWPHVGGDPGGTRPLESRADQPDERGTARGGMDVRHRRLERRVGASRPLGLRGDAAGHRRRLVRALALQPPVCPRRRDGRGAMDIRPPDRQDRPAEPLRQPRRVVWSNGESRRIFLGDIEAPSGRSMRRAARRFRASARDGRVDMRAGMGFPDALYALTSRSPSAATSSWQEAW